MAHPGMRKALQERLLKAEKDTAAGFDCKKEVAACYEHGMKQVRWERGWNCQPEYLDWEAVGRDLRRLLRKAEAFVAERPELALETAFLIMERNGLTCKVPWEVTQRLCIA